MQGPRRIVSPVRIGFLIDRWQEERGGAERALFALARHLASRGHEVHAFGLEGTLGDDGSAARFHRVKTSGWSRGRREDRLAWALVDAAHEAGCERTIGVRHLHEVDLYWPHGGSHLATLAARERAARRGRIPRRGPRVRGRHATFVALERELVEGGARRIACPSRLVVEEFAALYPLVRPWLAHAPNGVDLERFHPRERAGARARLREQLALDERTTLVSFVASNPLLKGLRELASVLRSLGTRRWFLLVAGPRRPARWSRALARWGIDTERFLVVPHADAVELAAGVDLCVLPTWRDPCGMVVLEALAAGTRVVTTRLAGASEVVRSIEHGEVVDHPGDSHALRAALERSIDLARSGASEPDAVRAAVLERGEKAWLERLEHILFEIPARGR
jgi:UDP-glucose:(heptosyl)LPS alpha-1,3-glucosyltransferase